MTDLDASVARGLAANPAAPVELLLRLAADAERRATVARALLDRRDIPPPVAQVLAAHPHPDIRRRLARHRSMPDEIRSGLAEDPDPGIRAEVADWPSDFLDWPHPTTAQPLPVEVYRRLAADAEPEVRAALGRNDFLPENVRVVLAGDPDPEVRRCTALRALPTALLHQLIGDADPAVRQAALDTAHVHAEGVTISPELAEPFLDGSSPGRAAQLVELTPALLERLWARPELRFWLARNPSLPTGRMRGLMDEANLRIGLAGNPRLPAPLLEELVATDEVAVQAALAARTDLPDRLRRRLRSDAGDDAIDDGPLPAISLLPEHASLELRLSYLGHPNLAFRRALAMSSDLPPEAVRRLADDPDFGVRLMICERYQDVPPATVAEVAARWPGHTRFDLLRHRCLPAESAALHAASDNAAERATIAERPDLPAELALLLVADSSSSVRRAAAANPNLPVERIVQLLGDPDVWLREGAAANPALPVEEMLSIRWQP